MASVSNQAVKAIKLWGEQIQSLEEISIKTEGSKIQDQRAKLAGIKTTRDRMSMKHLLRHRSELEGKKSSSLR